MSSTTQPSDNLTFAWDRPETADSLKQRLVMAGPDEWIRLAAWILREARVAEVWQFLTLKQVAEAYPRLSPFLGRRRPLWDYLLHSAHELGRI
jgi:hypothetical protein